jgi:predicted phage-related endonuclease
MERFVWTKPHETRRAFIGGSDARVIMGDDEAALVQLWREKRGEAGPPDYSGNLIVQLGVATEPLNRRWYEQTTGRAIKDVQSWVPHPVIRWMAATLDGTVEGSSEVFEAKFMLPWSFSEEMAARKHMAQLQHNMWVTNASGAVLSIITGGGKWVEIKIPADSALPASSADGGKEILALRRVWRAPSALHGGITAGPHRGRTDR